MFGNATDANTRAIMSTGPALVSNPMPEAPKELRNVFPMRASDSHPPPTTIAIAPKAQRNVCIKDCPSLNYSVKAQTFATQSWSSAGQSRLGAIRAFQAFSKSDLTKPT